MKRLDRYVIRELIVPLIIGTIVIALLFLGNELIFLFKTIDARKVPVLAFFQLSLYKMPHWLNLTLPAGMAMGASLAIARLARESEITAMRAAGIRVWRIIWPVLMVGALISVVNFVVVDRIMPPAARAGQQVESRLFQLAATPTFQSNVVVKLDRYTASIGSVNTRGDGTVELTDILLYERPGVGEVALYSSPSGTYSAGVWTIDEPYIYLVKGIDLLAGRSSESVTIDEEISLEAFFGSISPDQESVADLRQKIADRQRLNQDTQELEIRYHVKYSVPASCLLFAFAGALLAIRTARMGPFIGVLISLGLVLIYYNMYVVSTEIIGRNAWLSPVAAAWLPNAIYLVIGVLLLRGIE